MMTRRDERDVSLWCLLSLIPSSFSPRESFHIKGSLLAVIWPGKREREREGNPEWEDKKSIAFCSGTEKMFLLFATRKQEGLAYPVGSDGGIRHPTTEMAGNSTEYIPFLPSFLFLIPISHSLLRCPSTGSDRELSKARASGTWG